jgi:hypothetical protein
VATNRFQYPGFESGVLRADYYATLASVTNTSKVVTTPVISGDYSFRLSCSANANATTNSYLTGVGWHLPAAPGDVWSVSCHAGYLSNVNLLIRLVTVFRDAAKANLGSSTQVDSGFGGRTPVELTVTTPAAPAGTAYILPHFQLVLVGPAGTVGEGYIDNLMAVQNEALPDHWFDGDTGDAYWNGPRWASSSTEYEDGESFAEMREWVPNFFTSVPA